MALIKAGADVNAANESGVTPMHSAANGGHIETAVALIEGGAGCQRKAQGRADTLAPGG